jgi:hypothetical protein
MKNVSVVALVLATTACVTAAPFQPGKPVEKASAGLGTVYKQDGKPINARGLLEGLKAYPPARSEAEAAGSWATGGMVLGGIGGFGVGYGLVSGISGKNAGWAVLAGGAVFVGAGMWCGSVADRHAGAAVDAYNGGLGSKAPSVSLAPWLAPVEDRVGGRTLQAGIGLRF